jgi:hypothetical protein
MQPTREGARAAPESRHPKGARCEKQGAEESCAQKEADTESGTCGGRARGQNFFARNAMPPKNLNELISLAEGQSPQGFDCSRVFSEGNRDVIY